MNGKTKAAIGVAASTVIAPIYWKYIPLWISIPGLALLLVYCYTDFRQRLGEQRESAQAPERDQ